MTVKTNNWLVVLTLFAVLSSSGCAGLNYFMGWPYNVQYFTQTDELDSFVTSSGEAYALTRDILIKYYDIYDGSEQKIKKVTVNLMKDGKVLKAWHFKEPMRAELLPTPDKKYVSVEFFGATCEQIPLSSKYACE